MPAQFTKHFVQDLTQDIKIRQCGTIVFNKDDNSNILSVDLYNGQEEYSGGGSVAGACICPDGSTVPLTGSIDGKTASVTLTGDCFAFPGQIGIGVQVISGTVKTTVLKAIYNVELFETDDVVDPGSRLTVSVADLVQDIAEAVATIPPEYTDLLSAIAPTFSTSTAYKVGQYVWYDGKLYRFMVPHAAGSWLDTETVQIAVSSELFNAKSDFNEFIGSSCLGITFNPEITLSRYISSSTGKADAASSGTYACTGLLNGYGSIIAIKTTGSTFKYRVHYYGANAKQTAGTAAGNDYLGNTGTFSNEQVYVIPSNAVYIALEFRKNTEQAFVSGDDALILATLSAYSLTDTTLTHAGIASDAKATGDEIRAVKTDLKLHNIESPLTATWEQGKIATTGKNSESTSPVSIRCKYLLTISTGDVVITADAGYTFKYFIYSGSSFDSITDYSENWLQSINLHITPNYKIRLMVQKDGGSSNISPSDGDHVQVVLVSFSDVTLTMENKPADSKTTGDRLSIIEKLSRNLMGNIIWEPELTASSYIDSDTGIRSTSTATYARTTSLSIGYPKILAIELKNSNYLFNLAYYDSTGNMTDGTGYLGCSGYVNGLVIIPENAVKIGASFIRTDKASMDMGDSGTDQIAILSALSEYMIDKYPSTGLSMYSSFAVCGASWDSGYIYPYPGSSTIEKPELSWGANVCKRNGIAKFGNFSWHGTTTRTRVTDPHCLPALLEDEPYQIYVLGGTGNDVSLGLEYLGSISDITSHQSYTDYPDTFYGNYGKIIEQIKAHAPNAFIILLGSVTVLSNSVYHAFDSASREIAQHYGLPFILWNDDPWYGSNHDFDVGITHNHPTAPLLAGMAQSFERLYAKCYLEYPNYFNAFSGV